MSDADIEIFKRRGLWAVLNPASNLKLASGIAPAARFIKEGIGLAIGTDGAGSNNALDMFREMYLVTALAKYREGDASAVDANEVLKMACVGGARAMGLLAERVFKECKELWLLFLSHILLERPCIIFCRIALHFHLI